MKCFGQWFKCKNIFRGLRTQTPDSDFCVEGLVVWRIRWTIKNEREIHKVANVRLRIRKDLKIQNNLFRIVLYGRQFWMMYQSSHTQNSIMYNPFNTFCKKPAHLCSDTHMSSKSDHHLISWHLHINKKSLFYSPQKMRLPFFKHVILKCLPLS